MPLILLAGLPAAAFERLTSAPDDAVAGELRIYRELAKTNPAFLPDLAMALNNLGLRKKDLGDPKQARDAFEESLRLLRPLADANPAFQDNLQRILTNYEEVKR